jgi:DNA-binding transcriptional LysR family regulator
MELRELVSFYHVAQLRSVSKAARTLELGQPTVTTHLRKLESEFGITLFDRIKRPIQVTSEGTTLLELVIPVVESVDTLKTQMDYVERRGSFVVGAYHDLLMHHLPKSIQTFNTEYPDVRLRLLARPYLNLIQLVKSGEIDLALCAPPPPDEPSLEFVELFKYHVVLLTPPNHQLLAKAVIELKDIAAWPMILPGPGSITRQHVEQALKNSGISFDLILAMDDSESIKRYVEIGMGVAVGNDFSLHPEDHDRLGVVRLGHLFDSSAIGICTLRGKFLGRAVRNFMDTMSDDLRGFRPEPWAWEDIEAGSVELASVGTSEP